MQNLLDAALLAQHKHEQLMKEKQCNVTKLPFELLALIFEELVHTHFISPTKISLVCRQWRSIILDMPGLWNTLRLDGKRAEWRTKWWMKHSQGRITNLVVHTSKNLEECLEKMGSRTTSQLEKVALDFKAVGENLPDFFSL
ncbi:9315_t:CDS:1 [Acaulospora colombiana]|uniref:9315_t:CDS:1 n=1 Tax=Acaulospora colombiana TaxID=27376 RepID=A0ACA9R862_9GLOM|nr:9315_t:CDS:1 [Acaulospora colombiana]